LNCKELFNGNHSLFFNVVRNMHKMTSMGLYTKYILLGTMRFLDKEPHKIAVLILATLLVGTGIVTAYNISDLHVIDKGNTIAVDPQNDNLIYTNNTIVVKGYLSPDLKSEEYLWIAVKPDKSIANWWPQLNGKIMPNKRGEFEGNAFLGGNAGDVFTIGILILNDTLNRKFSEWGANSKIENSWPPITEGDPINGTKVSKDTIENAVLVNIRIALKKENVMQDILSHIAV
jgi:hypothetical protein